MQFPFKKNLLGLSLLSSFWYLPSNGQSISRDPALLVSGAGFLNVRTIEPELEGKTQLFDSFKTGLIYVKGKNEKIQLPVNFDLYNKSILVLVRDQLLEVKINTIDSIDANIEKDSVLRVFNLEEIPGINEKAFGYYLFRGKHIKVIKQFDIDVIKPTYNELMNVGNRNYLIKPLYKYYISKPEDLQFTKIVIKKSSLLKLSTSKEVIHDIKTGDLGSDTSLREIFFKIDRTF